MDLRVAAVGIFVTTEVGTELIHPIKSRQENYFRDLSSIITGLASVWVFTSRGQFIEAAEKGEIMDLIEELRARENFLITAEVMKLLQLRRGTLCEWVRAGRIPAIRVGNAYLFDPRKLADWLTERTTAKTSNRRAA